MNGSNLDFSSNLLAREISKRSMSSSSNEGRFSPLVTNFSGYHGLPTPPIRSTSIGSLSYQPPIYPPPMSPSLSGNDSRSKYNKPTELKSSESFHTLNQIIFPPTDEMRAHAWDLLQQSEATFRIIYTGDVNYRSDKKLINKVKRSYFVLTNNQLLIFKSFQKSQSEINDNQKGMLDNDSVFLNLSSVYAIQTVATLANTFRIEYLHHQSGQPLSHTFTVETEKEMKQWLTALRNTIQVHHPRMDSITSTERFNVLDRLSKQSDSFENTDNVKIFKVIFKEKRYKNANEAPKEMFLPVILAIGKFSFYLLPITSADNEYLKTVERDRFGLLSILSIRYEDIDDTVIINVKQVGKSNRQLAFASTFCKDIVHYIRRGIESIIPGSENILSENTPGFIKHTKIVPFQLAPDPQDQVTMNDDEEVKQFHIILRAFAASMNLNKFRINFNIHGPIKTKIFTLLPPNEINQSSPFYEKYELLAILRTIQYNNMFMEISFANQSLDCLESWKVQENHGWTQSINQDIHDDYVLPNEIYHILVHSRLLRKLDLTNCSIGTTLDENSIKRKNTALAALGMAMISGKTNLSRISIGKNNITIDDLNKLIQGIKEHKKSIKELHLNECGLYKDMIESLLKVLYEKNPEQLVSLDLSVSCGISLNPIMMKRLIPAFKRLEVLRIRGHQLLGNLMLDSSQLKVLDIGNIKLDDQNISRLCHWIQTPSFQRIKELHLGNCHLNGKHVYDLLVCISHSGNREMHLNLENNPIMKDVAHLPKLQAAFTQNEGPTSISVARLEWDDSTLREFIDCLRDNHIIKRLNMSDINMKDAEEISQDTVRMLISLFERNVTLTELELNFKHNKERTKSFVADAILKALPGLKNNRSLEHLDISGLNLHDIGAFTLSRVLKTNRSLQSIVIDNNNISIEGYKSLIKVIQEEATQVIHLPSPQNDLRNQLKYLKTRIEELVVSENEAQFFLIHTTTGDKKRAKKHELEMMVQERKTCEMAVNNFENIIKTLEQVIKKNLQEFEVQSYQNLEYRLQAEMTAQNLARAQIRIQERSPSVMSGTELSAVGVPTRNMSVTSFSSNSSSLASKNHKSTFYSTLYNSPASSFYETQIDNIPFHPQRYEQNPGFLSDFGFIDDTENKVIGS